MNIALIGPMGSGKTSVGKKLAQSLNFDFIDTDDLIAKKEGMSITKIFETYGEHYFREIEKEIASEVSKLENCIISTGGGIILNAENVRRLRRNGMLIYLKTTSEVLFNRLKDAKDRPLSLKKTPPSTS